MAERSDSDARDTKGAWEQAAERSFTFLFVVVCLLAIAWMCSNCREVPPDSRAVVLRLGTVVRVQGAGLLLAAPRPFEQVLTLPSVDRQIAFTIYAFQSATPAEGAFPSGEGLTDPSGAATPISRDPAQNVAMLMTGDMSVVHFDARLFYRITNPTAYVRPSSGCSSPAPSRSRPGGTSIRSWSRAPTAMRSAMRRAPAGRACVPTCCPR
jgi:regulator of protease activity HflC (stomatin/prohibitin superfamily)